MASRFSGQSESARAQLTRLGESLGFSFDYFDGMRMVNTFRAHQLLYWAAGLGRQTDLKLALFDAFFRLHEDVNDPATLVDVASRTFRLQRAGRSAPAGDLAPIARGLS